MIRISLDAAKRVILGCLLAGFGALALAGCNSDSTTQSNVSSSAESGSTEAPRPSGPQPKVVLDESEFDFGAMEVGEEREHVFTIRNAGEATLELTKGQATCKCTLFELDKTRLAPGESAAATVRWKIEEPRETFQQQATITTNDPEMQEITLVIKGKVAQLFVLRPSMRWDLGELAEDKPTEFTGQIISAVLDEFEVTAESSDSRLTAEVTPLSEEELKEAEAKSGYKVRAVVTPGVPVGEYNQHLMLKTRAREEATLKVDVVGRRSGPLRIVGLNWQNERMVLNLGTFSAAKGMKAQLTMFVEGNEPLEIVELKPDPEDLQVRLTRDEKFQGKSQRYLLEIEVPAGARPLVRNSGQPARVSIQTSREDIGTIQFRVLYVSL